MFFISFAQFCGWMVSYKFPHTRMTNLLELHYSMNLILGKYTGGSRVNVVSQEVHVQGN